jgi:hypothetical protein
VHEAGKVVAYQLKDDSGFKAEIKEKEMRAFVEHLAAHLARELS